MSRMTRIGRVASGASQHARSRCARREFASPRSRFFRGGALLQPLHPRAIFTASSLTGYFLAAGLRGYQAALVYSSLSEHATSRAYLPHCRCRCR